MGHCLSNSLNLGSSSSSSISHMLPTGDGHLNMFERLVVERTPFTFVRFSDGETEILRNYKVVIANGITEFRGHYFNNQFPEFDQKCFDPRLGEDVRRDLLSSAMYSNQSYFKGVPTRHNNAVGDREFMLRLNGGFTPQMTFSDLFVNSNFLRARKTFFPSVVASFAKTLVVGNWRCQLKGYLAEGELIKIPDDFFSSYQRTLDSVFEQLLRAPQSALVLSSASSLSNVLGHKLRLARADLTFLDIGTVLNDLLSLSMSTRVYHKLMEPTSLSQRLAAWRYRQNPEYLLRW